MDAGVNVDDRRALTTALARCIYEAAFLVAHRRGLIATPLSAPPCEALVEQLRGWAEAPPPIDLINVTPIGVTLFITRAPDVVAELASWSPGAPLPDAALHVLSEILAVAGVTDEVLVAISEAARHESGAG